jgi:Family of unknown function (DUF6364)
MGKVKLTLTIEEALILQAKGIAKQNSKSLSKTIEEYLTSLCVTSNSIQKKSETLTLRGIAKSGLQQKTDKEIKAMMYKDKFGI